MTPDEMLDADSEMLLFMYSTPTGHAYIRTAIMAAMMRISLSHAWTTHGKALLARLEAQQEDEPTKKGTVV